jgi:hypothetical protein
MTLESSIEALAAAINRVADALSADKPAQKCACDAKKADKQPEKQPEAPGKSNAKQEAAATPPTATATAAAQPEKAENSGPVTLKDLKPLLSKLWETKGDAAAEELVKSLGVAKLSQLPAEKLAEAKAALEKALA